MEDFANPNAAYESRESEEISALLTQEQEQARGPYYAKQLARIHRRRKPPGNWLELGCGTGGLSHAASIAGWDVQAVEPGPALCKHAGELLGQDRVQCCKFEQAQLAPQSFDVIVALDILEHLTTPDSLFEQAGRWLRPGGLFVLQTPNTRSLRRYLHRARWNLLCPDTHFILFAAGGLNLLAGRHGFETLDLFSVSGRGSSSPLRRVAETGYGSLLGLFGLGNAHFLTARK